MKLEVRQVFICKLTKMNGKKYVGSSIDLNRRLLEYFNKNTLSK